MNKTFQRVSNFLIDVICTGKTDAIELQDRLKEDLMLDTLDIVDLIIMCEEEFSITLSDKEIYDIKTVSDLVNFIAAHTGTPPPTQKTNKGQDKETKTKE